MQVAIVAESLEYDGELYRALLQRLLDAPITRWNGRPDWRFDGCRAVLKLAETYLRSAADDGVRHALLAIDNDGTSRSHLAHRDDHVASQQAADEDGCRHCHLASAVPSWWSEDGRLHCIVVPVQAIETWLLHLRGDAFPEASPEHAYHRPTLKKRFFGRPTPPIERRLALALDEIARPDALDRLRDRPSFRLFESQLAAWRAADASPLFRPPPAS